MQRKLLSKLLLRAFLFLGAALPGSAAAAIVVSDVAGVCAIPGNSCVGNVANINKLTTAACPSTLDFVNSAFPNVVINAGGELKTTGASECQMALNVKTLRLGPAAKLAGGKITHAASNIGYRPGHVTVKASDTIQVDSGAQISVGGGPGTPGPIIELEADGDIRVFGKLLASAMTTGAVGGHIGITSNKGKVIIEPTAVLLSTTLNPGHNLILIQAETGLEIYGSLNASGKLVKEEIHLCSNGYIDIIGGKVIVNKNYGSEVPPRLKGHNLTIEAVGDITIDSVKNANGQVITKSIVQANGERTGGIGGAISILSTNGKISCDGESLIQAVGVGGGGTGGKLSLRSLNDLSYNCTIDGQGNTGSGTGGTILLKSFRQDVKDVQGKGKVSAIGKIPGTITLEACANPITGGGTVTPAPSKNPDVCFTPVPTPADFHCDPAQLTDFD